MKTDHKDTKTIVIHMIDRHDTVDNDRRQVMKSFREVYTWRRESCTYGRWEKSDNRDYEAESHAAAIAIIYGVDDIGKKQAFFSNIDHREAI